MTHYLGIDIGTSGTKTLLIDESGKVIAEANAEYPLHQPKPSWTEQDPEDWWNATIKTVRSVMKKSQVSPDSVGAIGLSGQMRMRMHTRKSLATRVCGTKGFRDRQAMLCTHS